MRVTAFKVMSVDAVVIIRWWPSVRRALFGMAVIDVPSTKTKKKFAHVELGIAATVDPGTGLMKLEAQLSPNTFIQDPSCHLSGDFAYVLLVEAIECADRGLTRELCWRLALNHWRLP